MMRSHRKLRAYLGRLAIPFSLLLLLSIHTARASDTLLLPEGESFSTEVMAGLMQVRLSRLSVLVYDHRGTTLATGEESGRVCLWDVQQGTPLRCLAGKKGQRVTALQFDPSDEWLAVGYSSGQVELHQRDGHADSCVLPALEDKLAIGRTTTSLHFGSDGSLLAMGAKKGALRKWHSVLGSHRERCTTGPVPAEFPIEDFPSTLIESTTVDPQGEHLAVSFGTSLGVWELGGGRKLWLHDKLPSNGMAVALALSPDGKTLAVGMLDGGVLTTDVSTGRTRTLPSPHTHRKILALSFAPDGGSFAVAADDQTISIWTVPSLRQPQLLKRGASVTALAFSPRGTHLATASEDVGVSLWDTLGGYVEAKRGLRGNASAIRTLTMDRKGQRLVTLSEDRELRVWERGVRDGKGPPWRLKCRSGQQPEHLAAVTFTPPEETQLAVAGDGRRIRLFDATTCRPSTELESPSSDLSGLAYSNDGRFLAAGSEDGTAQIYDVAKRDWRKESLRGHQDGLLTLAFSEADSTLLATASYDKTVRLWNVVTGTRLHSFPAQAAGVRALAFSADSTVLAMAAGQEVSLWRLADRTQMARLAHDGVLSGVRFLRDGTLVTTERSGTLRLWDVSTQKERSKLAPKATDDEIGITALTMDTEHGVLLTAGLGRVVERNLQDGFPMVASVWQGPEGWAAFSASDGKLFRHESGGLLWRRLDRGVVQSLPPPETFPNLRLDSRIENQSSPWTQTIRLTVSNMSESKPALWLKWRLLCGEGEESLPLGVSASLPSTVMRLDAGDTLADIQIPIALHWNKHLSAIPPMGTLSLLIEVKPQSGNAQRVPITVRLGPWWWPSYRLLKIIEQQVIVHRQQALFLSLSLAALGVLLWRRRVLSDPLIQMVLRGESPLQGKTLREFPVLSAQLLRGPFRREELRTKALNNAGLDERRWRRIVAAQQSPVAQAELLAESLLAQLSFPALVAKSDLAVFRITLPPLSIHVPDFCTLIVCMGEQTPQRVVLDLDPLLIRRDGVALVVDLTATQTPRSDVKEALRHVPGQVNWVILSESETRTILLDHDSQEARAILCRAIVTQSPMERVSPYRSSGTGIEDAYHRSFLGRQRELEQLLAGHHQNFLLVGPRRMGKSSLLKALRRELQRQQPSVLITTFCFDSSGSLSALFFGQAGLCADTPDDLYRSVLTRSEQHQVFLLDEVDYFLDVEKRDNYPFCSMMRALSAEGRASFVMSGHREVQEALRTADHPLRNFGEKLLLGPLDRESAAQMIAAPVAAFGLRLTKADATIDWICDQTACRPHLLAFVGATILKLREPYAENAVPIAEIQAAVLRSATIKDDLGNWDGATGNSLIDGMVLRSALLLGQATIPALADFLRGKGVLFQEAGLRASVHRIFDMHYGLILNVHGEVFCPLPLLAHHLSNPDDAPNGQPWPTPKARLLDELARDVQSFTAQAQPT